MNKNENLIQLSENKYDAPYHESLQPSGHLGIRISMAALENPYLPMHWHEAAEILFCLNGEVNVQVGRESLKLSSGELIVFDAGEVHSLHSASTLYMFLCIHIDKKQLSIYCPDLELYKISCRPSAKFGPQAEAYAHLCTLANELTRINITKDSTSAMRSDATVLLLLADLVRDFSVFSPTVISSSSSPNETIRLIVSYVTENYAKQITLGEMANMVGFSKEYFCRFFKQHIGVTFLQYLYEVRISHAARLLSTSDITVADAMLKCGFTNQTIFNRLFKKIYGMTPREVRKISSFPTQNQ